MVRTGQDEVERFGFRPRGRQVGLEALAWSELDARSGPLVRPHRTSFHTLLLVDDGRLAFHLDFVERDCGPRSLIWARPGQVQQIGTTRAFRARVLLFVAEFPAPSDALVSLLRGPQPPWAWDLTANQNARVSAAFDELDEAVDRADEPLHLPLAQHALTALLLALGTMTEPGRRPASSGEVFARLHDELERSYTTTRRAEDCAQRLGYSLKTVNRAAQAATGLTAKQLIDERVVLEAKRALAHTDASAETIAHQLGFTQATNFAKFFTRHTGETIGIFRLRVRGA